MRACIVIESWKESIFRRELDAAKYKYQVWAGAVAGTMHVYVEYTDQDNLGSVVERAQEMCCDFVSIPPSGTKPS